MTGPSSSDHGDALRRFLRDAMEKRLRLYGIDPEQRIPNEGALADSLADGAMGVLD